jgi:hypothetical protein
MSTSNPVIEVTEIRKKSTEQSKILYPVKVYCIVDDISDASRDLRIKEIKTHAVNSGAIFMTRLYDSRKYSTDRHIITRLPAFHVYIKNGYDRTFYSNTRPLDHINECINIYLKEQDEIIKKKEQWRRLYQNIKNFVWKLFHRETAMERYNREHIPIKKSRFENTKVNVSEWN